MGERTSHAPGTFSSVDLATSDSDAAKSFYGGLFGWQSEDMDGAGAPTRSSVSTASTSPGASRAPMAARGFRRIGTRTSRSRTWTRRWRGTELGGSVLMQAQDVAQIGRMAVIADPAGAGVALWEPRGMIGAELVNAPGAACWNDLGTTDLDAAMAFYGELFGWTFEQVSGVESRHRIRNRETENGSLYLQGADERGVPPNWLVYFATADLQGSDARVTELGGQVVVDPLEVAAGGRVSVVTDPRAQHSASSTGRLIPRGGPPRCRATPHFSAESTSGASSRVQRRAPLAVRGDGLRERGHVSDQRQRRLRRRP